MSNNEIFSVSLDLEKINSVFKTLGELEEKQKCKIPYGLVFHPKTLQRLIVQIQKNTPVPTPQESFINFCMGINVYSGDKVPEHVVKVAYSQKEVDEIIKHGETLEQKEHFENYIRRCKESEG